MTSMEILSGRRDFSGGYKVDVSRGKRVGRVSSEWFSRPADEQFLSLSELFASVRGRAERSRTRTVESAAIRVEASRDNTDRLALMLPGSETPVAPTHWSFRQLAALVGAPAAYLRQLPAPLAGINLQYGLTAHRAEQIKTLEVDDGRVELRAVTGPDYGRGGATHRRRRRGRHALEGARRSRLVDRRLQPARRCHPRHDDPLRLRSRCVSVSRGRPQPDRGRELLAGLDTLKEGEQVIFKLTIPDQDDFYADLIKHPKARVVALSGGYSRDESCEKLARNHGMIASFSRALAEGLTAQQSDKEFNKTLKAAVDMIYQASIS